jgi:hypothetical protein
MLTLRLVIRWKDWRVDHDIHNHRRYRRVYHRPLNFTISPWMKSWLVIFKSYQVIVAVFDGWRSFGCKYLTSNRMLLSFFFRIFIVTASPLNDDHHYGCRPLSWVWISPFPIFRRRRGIVERTQPLDRSTTIATLRNDHWRYHRLGDDWVLLVVLVIAKMKWFPPPPHNRQYHGRRGLLTK